MRGLGRQRNLCSLGRFSPFSETARLNACSCARATDTKNVGTPLKTECITAVSTICRLQG